MNTVLTLATISVIFIMCIIEAIADNTQRLKGINSHKNSISIFFTVFAYLVLAIILGYGNWPATLMGGLIVFWVRAAIFDYCYALVSGSDIHYVSNAWYDSWKKKLPYPNVVMALRIISIFPVTYYLLPYTDILTYNFFLIKFSKKSLGTISNYAF
jgi:hypothetical protein